eukprot:m51a1_g1394 hypothetical protein (304) ;mRNA; f:481368-482425
MDGAPPARSRVVPTVASTLDDLVFAAFQGPVLSLSSRVLHQFRTFTALLLLRTRWRTDRGLSRADVSERLLASRCCAPPSLETRRCDVCGAVLELAQSPEQECQLQSLAPQDIEVYAVHVRTRCTSSRQHLGNAMLVLAADLAPGIAVVSQQFSVYARRAGRHAPAAPEPRTPASTSSEPLALTAPAPSPLGDSWRHPASPMSPGMALSVRICVVTYTPEEQQAIALSLVPLLRQRVPGFVLLKTGLQSGLAVIVMGCSSAGSLEDARHRTFLFISNADVRNPLNRNLFADGVVRSLAHATYV